MVLKDNSGENMVPLHQLVEETVAVIKPYEILYGKTIPVIAGGGIHSGKMHKIMQAGAKGVKIGTRFRYHT